MVLEAFSEKEPESIKKALGFSLKVDGVIRLCKTLKTLATQRFGASKKLHTIPYNTCRSLILLVPFALSEKGTGTLMIIRFSLQADGVRRLCKT